MTMPRLDLYLHTTPGMLWYAWGTEPVRRLAYTPGQDICQTISSLPGKCRILGLRQHAPLILQLLRRYTVNHVEVAGPQYLAGTLSPQDVLHRMATESWPASMGGWHPVTADDYYSYELVSRLLTGRELPAKICHPALPALRGIPGLSLPPCLQLLGDIVDPRWHVNPLAASRASRFLSFLGLHPEIQAAVDNGRPRGARGQRCRWLAAAWGSVPRDQEPGAMFWRVAAAAGGGSRGRLRASRLLALYLYYSWLAVLQHGTRYSGSAFLFAPDMLLHRPEELAAFQAQFSG